MTMSLTDRVCVTKHFEQRLPLVARLAVRSAWLHTHSISESHGQPHRLIEGLLLLQYQFEFLLHLVHPVEVQDDIGGVDGRI